MGTAEIRWQPSKLGGFEGVVISKGRRGEILFDEDETHLRVRLRNEAGKLEPGYFGMDGAIARFLEFMPGGLRGDRSVSEERQYKLDASQLLNDILPIEAALDATPSDAEAIRNSRVWLNLLSPYEMMHMKETLKNREGPALLRSAAKFALGDFAAGARGMEEALKKYGRQSWAKATYFGYLWRPTGNMFCKPTVTKDFAERIGHPFQYIYDPNISGEVYECLVDLADQTLLATQEFGASDYIDVQSFIYVVGGYTEKDRPEKEV